MPDYSRRSMSMAEMSAEKRAARHDQVEGAPTAAETLKTMLLSPLSLLLVCAPLGIASSFLHWGDQATFWLNFCAMIPLAKLLGDATEELAACLKNDMLAGLLNATFGNAVEMIMTFCLLKKGMYAVVKFTLVGSILSNLLLVLGCSFFFGGASRLWAGKAPIPTGNSYTNLDAPPKDAADKGKEQEFNKLGSVVNTSMLLLASLVMSLVTIFNQVDDIDDTGADFAKEQAKYMIPISRNCSIITIISYIAYIFFQLKTHTTNMKDDADDDDTDSSALGLTGSLCLLSFFTIVVAVCSEFLTEALESAVAGSVMSKAFVGIVLLPIVGNACEHASAVRFAIQDKIGLSVGIAVGSSVQMALFVTPLSVLMGWAIGDVCNDNMTLNLGLLNVAVLTMSVVLVVGMVVDGKSNWLEGFMLIVAYCIISILYWYLPDDKRTPTMNNGTVSCPQR